MIDDEVMKALRAIAEGYSVHGINDRFIVVENPKYEVDNGKDPFLVIDLESLNQDMTRIYLDIEVNDGFGL